jgi:hypothetical protein
VNPDLAPPAAPATAIGVDFDNTLICYDAAFHRSALEAGLIGPGVPASKRAVRDAVRLGPGGDLAWQRLQHLVYGPGIGRSRPAPGALAFLERCRALGIPLYLISHKTEHASLDPGGASLRAAALDWLETEGFFRAALVRERVRFGSSRAEKLEHIRAAGCSHFIDDLEEVFREPGFPGGTRGILYAPDRAALDDLPGVALARSWAEVAQRVFGG